MKISAILFGNSLPKMGIYCIENIKNGKIYIGSSKNMYERLHKHKWGLNKNLHQNRKLQNSWNKHTESNFICYCLEYCSFEDLTIREQYYINKLNPFYNITKDVVRNILSKESREMISETLKKKYKSGEISFTKTTPVNVYSINGDFIKTFNTLKECSNELNIHTSSILRILNGTYKQCKGYIFTKLDDLKIPEKLKLNKSGGKPKAIRKNFNSRSIIIKLLDLETNKILTFNSVKDVSNSLNINYDCFRQFLKNKKLDVYKKKYKLILPAPIKQGELLENPTTVIVNEDNQQPSLSSNTFEGSTTNTRLQSDNAVESNGNTSALPKKVTISILGTKVSYIPEL